MKTIHVVVEKYQKQWQENFNIIQKELFNFLDSSIVTIEHVGSTSVAGLSSKPIIDIDLVIATKKDFSTVKNYLVSMGYMHEGNLGIDDREAFTYQNKLHLQKHHLYVCTEQSNELKRHLAFRDYSRLNPESIQEYSKIKEQAARLFPYDILNINHHL